MKTTFIDKLELISYTLIGVVATAIDWTIFAIAVNIFSIHYEIALVLAYGGASLAHFSANKFITFKCASKNYTSQLSIYIIVLAISLLGSMLIMALLVSWLPINKIYLRILTTILMLLPNYLLHKNITFNKHLFAQHAL